MMAGVKTRVSRLVLALCAIAAVASAQTQQEPSQKDLAPGPATARWQYRHSTPKTPTSATVYDPTMNVQVTPGTPLTYGAGQPDPHVVAASGIAVSGGKAYVIQDNTLAVGRRDTATGATDSVALPTGPDGARKFGVEYGNPGIKPDLEAIATTPDGRLVAFGSGDRPSSQKLWVIDPRTGTTQEINAQPFYEGLKANKSFSGPNLNLEGAVIDGNRLVLFQRGNKPGKDGTPAINAVGEVPLADALAGRAPKSIENVKAYQLGEIDGVRLTFSDATRGPDGKIYFIASAEGKDKILGSAIGYIDENGVARYGLVVGPDGKPAPKKLEGIAIDPKTGRVIAVDDADSGDPSEIFDLEKPEDPRKNYQLPGSVTLVSWNGAGAVGMDAGPFKDGRWTWAEGRHGRIGMDVLRADGTGRVAIGATREGVKLDAVAQGTATLLGISGETGSYGFGKPDDLSRANVQGQGRAFVGADGQGTLSAHLTKSGVHAVAGAQVFAGAKAKGEITGTIAICGLAVTGTGQGEVSAGAGAGAVGFFKVDWAKGTVKIGGQADATVGLGGGLGGTIEVSLEQIIRNPNGAGDCVRNGIKSASSAVGGWFQSGWQRLTGGPAKPPVAVTNTIVSMNGAYGANPLSGSGVGRYATTLPQRLQGEPSNQKAGRAAGAGMRR